MQFSYAGISFQLVKTNNWSAEAVYSDDGADYLYTHHVIDAEFILNPKATAWTLQSGVPVPTEGTLPATTFTAIRHALLQAREQLIITDYNGQTVLYCPAPNYTVDAYLGPKPLRCVPRVTGSSKTWAFRWVVECWINECEPGGTVSGLAPGVLSYRWQDEHHINQNHLTTRVITGTAKFRRDFLDDTVNEMADKYRILLNPIFPVPGFQRTNVDVIAKSDGTALQITIREEERMYDLGETDARKDGQGLSGSGIIRVEGAFGVTSISTDAGPTAGMSMQQFDCRVYGNKYANQWTMIQRVFQLALVKMPDIEERVAIIRHAAIRESLGQDEKWVEVTIAVQSNPSARAAIGNLRINSLRKSVEDLFQPQAGQQPAMPNAEGMRGTADVALLTQALGLACTLPASGEITEGEGDEGDGITAENIGPSPAYSVQTQDELDDEPSKYGVPAGEADDAFTHYRNRITIERTTGLAMAPATGTQQAYQPGGGSGGSSSGSVDTPPASDDWGGATGAFEGASGSSQSGLAASRFFRFTYPSERITMQFEAERIGSPPTVPSPRNNDENLVLLFAKLQPRSPIIANDGITPVFYVEGWYEYGRQTPIAPGDGVPMGALPWTTIAFADSVLTSDDFDHGIFDDGESTSSAATGPNV